jgi:hypothetical protein
MLAVISSPAIAAGKFQCWTNSDGVRECGNSVPPEYSQQRVETLNDKGMVVEIQGPAKTKEQLEQEKREEELRKAQEDREAEQRRKDMVLLRTFTTERDLKISYNNKTNSINGIIELTRSSNKNLRENLEQLQKRAANLERSGKPIPDKMVNEMQSVKRQIKNNEDFIAEKQQEIAELNKRYDADLKRFRELKSRKPH